MGKENLSIAPTGHRKAATDAFLAQFNAVEDSMALAAKLETQSLRHASNGRFPLDDHKLTDTHEPNIMTSTENLARCMAVTAIGADSPQPALTMADQGYSIGDQASSFSPESLNNKSYSSVGFQNVHAVGSLPNNFNGVVEGRQSVRAQLAAAQAGNKTRSPKSPRFLRRNGGNGTGA